MATRTGTSSASNKVILEGRGGAIIPLKKTALNSTERECVSESESESE